MARHRRRRSFRGITTIPGLSGFDILNKDVSGMDVIVGAAAGVIGSALVKGLLKQVSPDVAEKAGKFMPAATGIAVGAIAYYAQKKSKQGLGHAIGAAGVGIAMTAKAFAADALSGVPMLDFNEVTQVNLGRYGGLLVNDTTGMQGYGGLLVSDTTDNKGMNDLAQVSMGDDSDGIHELAGLY